MTAGSRDVGDVSASRLLEQLPLPLRRLIDTAVHIASARDVPIYLVGGPVRDLYLGRPITDLDLVTEGDAWEVAEAFRMVVDGQMTRHAAFRTAVVQLHIEDTALAVDFVTARRERYPHPAALPEITPSTILDDLGRRDFAVNALAIRLAGAGEAALLDPFAGIRDIDAGIVRVLHAQSFRDDPTRILRAARFAARLDFVVEPWTRELIDAALAQQMIADTSGQRVLNEIWLTLGEPQPERVLALLHEWGAFEQLGLVWSEAWPASFAKARATVNDAPLVQILLGLLVWPMNDDERVGFAARYNLPAVGRKLLRELPQRVPPMLERPDLGPVALDELLQAYGTPALRVLQIVAPPEAAQHIAHYLDDIRPLPPLLNGDDLHAIGIPPGPRYREILARIRRAQLDGTIRTRDEALRQLSVEYP